MTNSLTLRHAILALFMFSRVVCGTGQPEAVAAPIETTEQEALYSAIQGFVGKWWNGSDLYPDPCGWTPIQGVSCDLFDGFWYVTDMNMGPIHDNSLSCAPNAEFSPSLFALKHLKSLSFFNCFPSAHNRSFTIPTLNWQVFADSLESLEFRSNPGLVGQIPTDFANLRKLQSLVLLENGLRGPIPANIGNLRNLRRLVLSGNKLTGPIPDSFGSLSDILIFDLSRNSLSGPLPLTFGGLTSLLKLDLSQNQLEGKIPSEMGNLKNLTLLDLSHNNFYGGLSKALARMSSLEELVLSRNPIGGDLEGIRWDKLKELTILDLSSTGLTGGVPESISDLKRLRFLGLNDNNLTGYLSTKLAALPSLGAIYLNGNNLTGELKFSGWFYGKMGRRFRAWGNANLCFPVELTPTSHAPVGVEPCQQVTLVRFGLDAKSKFVNKYLNQYNSESKSSLAFSINGSGGIFCTFLVDLLVIIVVSSLYP